MDDKLFTYEDEQVESKGPVTCLGITFANDDERREYFRNELRKKLPELKLIEGFPIGEDEDIINLSDPPYYTACPNPWINDFIKEWEAEKVVLQAEGKRKANFEVKEPYAYGIKQGKNSTIYNAHSYHTKVPHEVIMRYILHYTQPGDIVFDGFAGTGMTGVAAGACLNPLGLVKTEIEQDFEENGYEKPSWGIRHAICGDLSPLCFHIDSNYNSSTSVHLLRLAVKSLIEELNERFSHFYTTKIRYGEHELSYHINYFVWAQIVGCKNCGHELNVHDLSFDYSENVLHDKLVCPSCGAIQTRNEATPINETIYDKLSGKTINRLKYECCLLNYSVPKRGRYFSNDIPTTEYPEYIGFVPTYCFAEGDKYSDPKRVGVNSVDQLYYERTKYVLAYLYNQIHTKYYQLKKPLMFIFTSMLPKLTRMNRYMPQHGSRALVGPMANTLYIPPQSVENNPIDQFEYQSNKVINALKQCNNSAIVQICSATHSSIQDCSVDFIFADPPFGSNIMYSELNSVSESWLKIMTNNKEEAISNKTQNKGLPEYQEIMTKCFREYNRILKPGKWMTVEFSNTSAAFWNSLQYSIKNAGFIISAITDLNKERGGLHSMLGSTAVKQDLAISCYKPTESIERRIVAKSKESIWSFVDDHLSHVSKFIKVDGNSVFITERDPRIIYDRVISYYIQQGEDIPIDANEFQIELKKRFVERDGMFFTIEQAIEYEEKKKDTSSFVSLALLVGSEAEGIEWLKRKLEAGPKTYSEILPDWMQDLVTPKKGDTLPELMQILDENFLKDENGYWHVPDVNDQAQLEAVRTKRLLKEFEVYVEAKKIKNARLEALRAGFNDCYNKRDFETIIKVANKLPEELLMTDEVLLRFYDIASSRV